MARSPDAQPSSVGLSYLIVYEDLSQTDADVGREVVLAIRLLERADCLVPRKASVRRRWIVERR